MLYTQIKVGRMYAVNAAFAARDGYVGDVRVIQAEGLYDFSVETVDDVRPRRFKVWATQFVAPAIIPSVAVPIGPTAP